jgi:hypothetical protein
MGDTKKSLEGALTQWGEQAMVVVEGESEKELPVGVSAEGYVM